MIKLIDEPQHFILKDGTYVIFFSEISPEGLVVFSSNIVIGIEDDHGSDDVVQFILQHYTLSSPYNSLVVTGAIRVHELQHNEGGSDES